MPLTAASFKAIYGEFSEVPDAKVDAKLGQAMRSISAEVLGESFDDAVGLMTARLLALSPSGLKAGLRLGAGANQRTPYDADLERLMSIAGGSFRVVLD